MSRAACICVIARAGFPRVSGDEPATSVADVATLPFSPRERG